MTVRVRRRLRTVVLAIVATLALFWGAVDLVGVPADDLLRELGWVVLGIVLIIALAAVAGALMSLCHRRRRH